MLTNYPIKNCFAFLFFLLAVNFTFAQEKEQEPEKHKFSVMAGVSDLKFFGNVGKSSDLNPLLDARMGYFLTLEQRFGKILGVQITGLYGKLAGTDNSPTSHLNFQSQIMQGHIMLTANFDGAIKENRSVSPFLNAGIGYMLFTSYADLTNARGDTLHYWKDGSTKNLSEDATNSFSAKDVTRDFNYETQLKTNGVNGTLVFPVGGGLNFHFGRNWTTSIGVNYNFCMTQWIDNTGKSSNAYLSANAGIQYEFKKKKKPEVDYSGIDFATVDHLDVDKDGVPDDVDNCHGTPPKVKVDNNGCPLDSDKDGVADYLDKEPKSKLNAKVDGFGVTINLKEIAKHQSEWNALAPERSKIFNVAPSKAYLDKIEAESRKANPKKREIPAQFKSADYNHDGVISSGEITRLIGDFFDGKNDFTVDSINQLIDFFFE